VRKYGFFIMLAAMLIAIVPTVAQEDDELFTIAQLITEGVEQNDAEFSTFLAAVGAADSVFTDLLSSEESIITVFAPTDSAFEDLIEALDTTPENLLADRAVLNDLLSYHIVPAMIPAETLVTLDGGYVGTLLRGEPLRVSVNGTTVIMNESTVLEADLFASNGIVHVIDTVLAPPPEINIASTGSIASTIAVNAAADRPQFTVLRTAIEAADPGILATLAGNVPYTLFAPTDEAFVNLLEEMDISATDLLEDTEMLNLVLSYHIVPGSVTLEDLVEVGALADTTGTFPLASLVSGLTVNVTIDDGKTMASEANIIVPNVEVTNGVIHVIDRVLVPPQ